MVTQVQQEVAGQTVTGVCPAGEDHLAVRLACFPVLFKEGYVAVQRVLHQLPQLVALQARKTSEQCTMCICEFIAIFFKVTKFCKA